MYDKGVLALAANIPHEGRLPFAMGSSERRSPICGSRVTVDLRLSADGRVDDVGMLVQACVLGRASAALLASRIVGRSVRDLVEASEALAWWLATGDGAPGWPGMEVLAPALPYTARHASIRLAFEAAAEAAERALQPADGVAPA